MKKLIRNTRLAVDSSQIVDIFIEDDIISNVTPSSYTTYDDLDEVIDASDMMALPGLCNMHTHSYMTLLKGVGDDLSFKDWLFGRVMPIEERLTTQDAYTGTQLACIEMLKSGTTCFLDMHMFEGSCARAVLDAGMRAVMSRGLTDGCGDDPVGGKRRLTEALREADAFSDDPLFSFMLAPHAIYTCSSEYLRKIAEAAATRGVPLHIHLSESQGEVDDCLRSNGCTPVEYLERLGIFEIPVVGAHCVHLTDKDIDILAAHNVTVVTCPKSNLKLGNGFAPLNKLLASGVRVCIGTDGSASNNGLNLFSEMCFVALIHKGIAADAASMPARTVLSFATGNAAKALGIRTGSIEPGYKADIVLLRTDCERFVPCADPVSALVYSCNGTETDTVIINGKTVMRKGELLTLDEEKIYADARKIFERIGG